MVLLFIFLCVYAAASGFKDGVLWSRLGADAFSFNEHAIFVVERIAVICAAVAAPNLSVWQLAVTIAAFLLAFSFCHNQAYYYCRAKIDKTPWVFTYSSSTSTAKLEFGFKGRVAQMVVGVGLLVAGLIWLS